MARDRAWRLSALLLAFMTIGPAWRIASAQAPPARRGPPAESPGGRPGPGGLRDDEETRAVMEQVMLVRLRRALRLAPGQESRVMPRVQRLLDSRREFAARRRAAVSHLRALLIDETAAESEIERGLRNVRAIEEEFHEQEKLLRRDIERDLSPAQQARMYLFEGQFRRSMQRRLMEARGRARDGLPPPAHDDGRPGGPAADDDDIMDREP